MTVLGLDLGAKRIGIAVSDPDGRIAFPAGVIESRGHERDLAAVSELIRARSITRVVIGLPVHMSGRRGPEAEAAQRFAVALAKAAGVPVETLDERWTSLEAERSPCGRVGSAHRDAAPERGPRLAPSPLARRWR